MAIRVRILIRLWVGGVCVSSDGVALACILPCTFRFNAYNTQDMELSSSANMKSIKETLRSMSNMAEPTDAPAAAHSSDGDTPSPTLPFVAPWKTVSLTLSRPIDDPSWMAYQQKLKEKAKMALTVQTEDQSSLVQALQASLAESRKQNVEMRDRIKSMTASASEHMAIISAAEHEKDRLVHELSLARAEISRLSSSRELQEHGSLESHFLQASKQSAEAYALEDAKRQIQILTRERDEAVSRVNVLDDRIKSYSPISHELSKREATVRDEVHVLQVWAYLCCPFF
jgi:hypothetical protein